MPSFLPELRIAVEASVTSLWEARVVRDVDAPLPYWALPWAGGLALARHLLDHRELVRGLRVVDVGTGSGVVAIAAALAGASHVRAIDVDREALAAAARNAEANGVAIELVEGDPFARSDLANDADVVSVADLFYESGLAERAIAWMHAQARAGRLVLAGDPGRAYAPREGVEIVARYEVPTSIEVEGRATRSAVVLRVVPPRPHDTKNP